MDEERKYKLAANFKASGISQKKAHVIVRKGQWVVFKEGAKKVIGKYSTKQSAISGAKKILKSGNTDMFVVHKTDGTVEKIQLAD